MKRALLLIISLLLFTNADSLKCEKRDNRIVCTYFSDRSDTPKDTTLKFHWISPKSPEDDRTREVIIPPYYGSAYDYRFIPGRVPGRWVVEVTKKDSNITIRSFFDINETEDEFFSN